MALLQRALQVLLISLALAMPASAEELNIRYLLVDSSHPSWPALRTVLTSRHGEIRSGNKLSVVLNDDSSRAVVKILGATPAWQQANGLGNHPAVLSINTDNQFAKDLMRSHPDWTKVRTFKN